MHKFFTEDVQGDLARITGDDVKHAWKVLRLKAGDPVLVNDLKGNDYKGKIRSVDKTEVLVEILEHLEGSNESPLEIRVYQGLPKGQKLDLVTQKLSELGVRRLTPILTRRVVPEVKDDARKLERFRRISLEAGKQAGRSLIMEIGEPARLMDLGPELADLDLVIVPYEEKQGAGIRAIEGQIQKARSIGIVVGPEGGFEGEEICWLEEQGARVVTLGPRILRTETCALTVVSILQYIAGDMGGMTDEGCN